MKRILFIVAILMCSIAHSQETVEFKLQPNATFAAPDGTSYIVIPFEGKTAEELYSMVKSNVMTLYKSPDRVMSENPHASISIRAYSDRVGSKTIAFIPRVFAGYYNLVFQFKDGKIRVNAPIIDDTLTDRDNMLDYQYIPSFRGLVKGYYKDGKPKDKSHAAIMITEQSVNLPINYLLGLLKTESNDTNDDW